MMYVSLSCRNILPDVVSQSYRELKRTGKLYTWDLFTSTFSPYDFLVKLETFGDIFRRGLPTNDELRKPAIARIFSDVLRVGSIVQSDVTIKEDEEALDLCYRSGWLHADKHSNTFEETVYVLPSQLHRWILEWKLFNSPPTELNSACILEFVVEVIARFSPRCLSTEGRIGPGSIQRPPEAQYQDEFYRSSHAYSNGSLVTFPEFGTAKGQVEFYIPFKEWGVELLLEGDRLRQHSSRFSPSGSDETTIRLSDYIMLDFRKTLPKRPHPGMCIICPSTHFRSFRANLTN